MLQAELFNRNLTPGITRREALTEASKLTDDIRATSGRVHAVVRLPVIRIAQRLLLAAKGIIQRPPRGVQRMRERGGRT
jgi:hypothetical protein